MKPTLILLTLAALLSPTPLMAATASGTQGKSLNEQQDLKPQSNPEIRNQFSVVIQGAGDPTAEADAKQFLSSIEGAKLESFKITEKDIEAVLSTKAKISRGDVNKVLRPNKDLKVTEFKAVRPER